MRFAGVLIGIAAVLAIWAAAWEPQGYYLGDVDPLALHRASSGLGGSGVHRALLQRY